MGLGIGIRKNAWLRGYAYGFIELFAPHLTRKMVMAALAGEEGSDPGYDSAIMDIHGYT